MGEPSDDRMCENCLFSNPRPDGRLQCRRFPPLFLYALPEQNALATPGGNNRVQMISFFGFPLVQPKHWCGEHKFAPVEADLGRN